MSSSATGVGMPICFLGAILLILTQKSSQKFGDVLGIMSRGAEKKVAKKPSCPYLRCLQRTKDSPNKRTVLFYKTLFYGVNKSRYSIFLLRSMEGTIFPFHLLKST
jgi:hypothetical protein